MHRANLRVAKHYSDALLLQFNLVNSPATAESRIVLEARVAAFYSADAQHDVYTQEKSAYG